LEDVPTEDWQCKICTSHSTKGVNDCIAPQEKQGSLCRHEHLGFDRHARKYWFVRRRSFVEAEDGWKRGITVLKLNLIIYLKSLMVIFLRNR
jgi:nucleosome-remodeling factor subunit BPTF